MKNCTHPRSKWHALATLPLLFFFLSFSGSAQLVAKNLKAANGESIGFYEYKPYDYNPGQNPKYPLIIFLHGIGERGNGTTDLPAVLSNGTPGVINSGHSMRFFWNGKWETFLVLIPQLSSNYGWWQNFYVDEMIKYAKANLNVDPDRITLTGLSLGGGGTWGWAGASPANAQTLNCIGLCCATCPNIDFSYLTNANLPIWAFHAKDDKTISEGCTGASIQSIEKLNPTVKPYYTVYPTGGHSIWGTVYDPGYDNQNPNIYEWFLAQNKSLPANKRPVANAGSAQTVPINTTVTLNASGSTDADGKLVRYIWSKKSGPGFGTITTPVSTDGKTTVTGLASAGTYVYEVKVVDDRCDWTFATVTITVVPGDGPNQAPTAKAGNDYSINQPTSTITLNGSGSVDPEGKMASYTWTQVSGPTTVNIASPNAATTTASNLTALGKYTFRLVVKDQEGLSGTAEITITVNGPNQVAIPNAGPDIVITLPNNAVTLDGSASVDPDGPISMYSWSKVTGPPDFTIVSPNNVKTNVTGLVAGVYTFKLTVYDNLWIPATDIVQVTVLAASGNLAPTANAGPDIALTLPTNSTVLNGLGSTDPNGNSTITSYKWTKVSGPDQFNLGNANAGSTPLTNLVAGTYSFKLTVTDDGGLSSEDIVNVIVNAPVNRPPTANAGTGVTLTLPNNSTTLNGSASSDPDGNNTITYAWAKISGPAQYTIGNATAVSTPLTNLVEGTYVFELTVTDNGGLSAKDQVTIVVKPQPAPANRPPTANAGTGVTLTLPNNSTTLNGSASSDPDGNNTISFAWAKISGPAQYTIGNATAVSTPLTNLVEGTYVFELTVTDNGGLSAKDQVTIVVKPQPAPANQPPVAKAGAAISVTLPVSSIQLDGSSSYDPDGTIVSYAWVKVSGSGNLTIVNAASSKPLITEATAGEYEFELTVTDNQGAIAKDRVKVSIFLPPNQLPVAIAGNDISVDFDANSVITLDGSASYDPDGKIVAWSWTKISGSGSLTIINAASPKPSLVGVQAGDYSFELLVTDDRGGQSRDIVKLTVKAKENKKPVAVAGKDITLAVPATSTILNGNQSYDEDGIITRFNWKQLSGPAKVKFDANAMTVELNKLEPGEYLFELTVTDDKGAEASDTVKVTVVNNMRYTASISAYPNPAQGNTITVRCITDTLGKATLTLMDQFGRPIEVHRREKTQAYQEFQLPIGHLKNGNYYIEVQIERKQRMVVKFVKR